MKLSWSAASAVFLGGFVAYSSLNIVRAAEPEGPFLPLAIVRLDANSDQLNPLIEIIGKFAGERHFQVKAANYPRGERIVINMEIDLSKQTHFYVGNFRSENVMEFVAYSHEGREIWERSWDELISTISETFGEANLTYVKRR